MRIISIDPGYEKIGIAILEKNKGDKKESLVFSECFKTKSSLPEHKRLKLIGQRVSEVIKKFNPEALAIEKLFFNTNQTTVMLVSEARGVIIYEASLKNLEIFEYTPLQIKIATTGYGRGDKKQVIAMVLKLIDIKKEIKEDDEYDAIAAGLTFFACNNSLKNSYPQKAQKRVAK
jgi:crossover junction endodeoxyribonuclease RuvC